MNNAMAKRAVLIVILAVIAFPPILAIAQDTSSAISVAKQQLISCYDSAKEAEAAGANISSLTSVLNEAGNLLSRAELAYSQHDYGTAQSLAAQSSQRLDGFVAASNSLRVSAIQQRTSDLWVNMVGSIVGAIVIILVAIKVWSLINRRGTRVEVLNNEPARV